jgi:hypothetical protein
MSVRLPGKPAQTKLDNRTALAAPGATTPRRRSTVLPNAKISESAMQASLLCNCHPRIRLMSPRVLHTYSAVSVRPADRRVAPSGMARGGSSAARGRFAGLRRIIRRSIDHGAASAQGGRRWQALRARRRAAWACDDGTRALANLAGVAAGTHATDPPRRRPCSVASQAGPHAAAERVRWRRQCAIQSAENDAVAPALLGEGMQHPASHRGRVAAKYTVYV